MTHHQAPRCCIVLQMGAVTVEVPVEISLSMLRTLPLVNRACRDGMRIITLCWQWAREIKRVQVLYDKPTRSPRATPACLWFPQIPFRKFAGYPRDIVEAVPGSTNSHICHIYPHPQWHSHNKATAYAIHHERMDGKGLARAYTPLEVWEAWGQYQHSECVGFELPMARDVVTVAAPRCSYRYTSIEHFDPEELSELCRKLPYVEDVHFLDMDNADTLRHILDYIAGQGHTYPRVKHVNMGLCHFSELSPEYLDIIERLFPRLICVYCPDPSPELIHRFGERWHPY